jgi:ketosteroid isomerase-like protein
VIYGPTGRVASRFVADMEGEWNGNTGVLRERFRYDSGRVQDREWTLRLGNDGRIAATAPDVVGTGEGVAEGPAVQMRYRIRLAAEAGGHVLQVTDWMYLMENGTIMNRSQFTKFGVTVAELVATMRRVEA